MPHLVAPDVGNYTFGAHSMSAAGASLGNLVTAQCNVEYESLTHFNARRGEEVEDPQILRRLRFTIEVTLDEPNKDNVFRFFLADATGKVGMGSTAPVALSFAGIPVVGNSFTWAIPKAVLRPNGNFGYNSEDWTQFTLTAILIPDYTAPTAPWGTITHNGVP